MIKQIFEIFTDYLKLVKIKITNQLSVGCDEGDNLISLKAKKTYSSSWSKGGAINLDNSLNNREGLTIYSNNGENANGPLILLRIDNEKWGEEILHIISNSKTSRGDIRIDAYKPEIEFVDKEYTGHQGKFELRVQGNTIQLNSRNAQDDSFEKIVKFHPLCDGGGMEIVPTTLPKNPKKGQLCVNENGELYFYNTQWVKII